MSAAPDPKTSTTQMARVRRNPWVMGLAATPFLICLFAVIGALAIHPGVLVTMLHGLIFGAVATWYAWGRNPWARIQLEDVRIDDEWLYLGNERHARADIKAGLIVPDRGHVAVQLQRRGLRPALELRVADEEEGRALLRRLGLAATQTVGSFRTMSRMQASMGRQIAVVTGGMAATGALAAGLGALLGPAGAVPTLFASLLVLMAVLFAPTRVDVGADGVLLRWLGRERFIEHGDIDQVATSVVGWGNSRRIVITLSLTSGERVVLPTGAPQFDFGRAEGLKTRIDAARAACQRGESVHAEALLRRGQRSHAEWVKALQASEARSGLRSAPVPRARLWRLLEDGSVDPLDRAVAAVSLGRALDADERSRLERTAAATAAPRLRIALDAVAHDEPDEALAESLAELEAEARQTARREQSR